MNAKAFGTLLVRKRREQGFETAYAFYHGREGRHWLKLSFANYLAIEKGRSLPKPWRVGRLAQALGFAPGSDGARELARTYLGCLEGAEELLQLAGFDRAPRRPGPLGGGIAEAAARQTMAMRTQNLNLKQWETMVGTPVNYQCHIYLVNTPGWSSVSQIADKLGLSIKEAGKALKALSAAKVVETRGTKARSLLAKKVVAPLPMLPETAGVRAAQDRIRSALAERRGKLRSRTQMSVRLPKAEVERYAQHLAEAVRFSAVIGDVDPDPDTAVYLIEGRVFELFS